MDVGLHPELSFDDYITIDAFSASCIPALVHSFPARLLHFKEPTPAMDDGRIAHALVLEGKDIEDSGEWIVVPEGFSMKHTKAQADLIAEIKATGRKPISEARVEMIRGMAKALRAEKPIADALSNGRPEVTAIWTDPDHGITCKARFDWLPNFGRIMPDYKTTACIDQEELSRNVKNFGMHWRAIIYEGAARHAAGRGTDEMPPIYAPIFQEKSPPYFAKIDHIKPEHLDLARNEVFQAMARWKYCKETGIWPGPQHFQGVSLPGYEVRRLEYEFTDAAKEAA